MLLWYKIAWRNIRNNLSFSLINLVGLTAGFAGAMLICCLLHYHLSFDSFHQDNDRIYRIVSEGSWLRDAHSSGAPQPVGKTIRNNYTYAESVAMVAQWGAPQVVVGTGDKRQLFNPDCVYAEPSYFDVFSFPFLEGNASALKEPYTAVITEKEAKRFFPGTDAMGKQILVDNKYLYTVAGVLKDIPENSSFQKQVYLSYANFAVVSPWMAGDSSWSGLSGGIQCFVKLRPGISAAAVEKGMPELLKKYALKNSGGLTLHLQSLRDIHFNRAYDGVIARRQLWGLGLLGLFLVMMAGINFVNLTTARLFFRSREAGVRKVLGSSAGQIRWQFILETGLMVVVAVVLSVLVVYSALPWFGRTFDAGISADDLYQPYFLLFIAGLAATVTLLVGYYPGSILARLKPVETIRGKLIQSRTSGVSLRKILVVVQFAIVLFMISCTLIIGRQLRSSTETDIGSRKSGIVMLNLPSIKNGKQVDALRNRLLAQTGVRNVSFCFSPPLSAMYQTNDFRFDSRAGGESFQLNLKAVDTGYLSVFDLKLLAGHNLHGGDTLNGCLVNETFVKKVNAGKADALIGKKIQVGDLEATILGVVKDFHTSNFHSEIVPVCLFSDMGSYTSCAVNLDVRDMKRAIAILEQVWKNTYPDQTWDYYFLDDSIRNLYHAEVLLFSVTQLFSILAVLVGCIGLLGLASFLAIQRRKEISIRKVLGASVMNVWWLFTREFAWLVLIAMVIGIPVAWYVMHHWLQDFAYRLPINGGTFLLPVALTFAMVLVTIGINSVRAALANPVRSLRNDE